MLLSVSAHCKRPPPVVRPKRLLRRSLLKLFPLSKPSPFLNVLFLICSIPQYVVIAQSAIVLIVLIARYRVVPCGSAPVHS